jgi:Domain of unknown function (DUF4177)
MARNLSLVKTFALLAILSLVMFFSFSAPQVQSGDRPQKKQWEYKIVNRASGTVNGVGFLDEKALNKYGDEGWELAGTTPSGAYVGEYIFKRMK